MDSEGELWSFGGPLRALNWGGQSVRGLQLHCEAVGSMSSLLEGRDCELVSVVDVRSTAQCEALRSVRGQTCNMSFCSQ